MTGKLHLHNHYNGLKTAVLFAIMWAIIMIIWWATGARTSTLGIYLAIGVGTSFISYWFSDKLAIASMHAQPVTEQQAPELYRIVRELSQRAGKPHLHRAHRDAERLRHRPQREPRRRLLHAGHSAHSRRT